MATIKQILGRGAVHPFPARMAPTIALDALRGTKGEQRVLDPMCGSGTVVAVARANGHRAVGVDCDPLAVLNARVWTTPVKPGTVSQRAADVLERAKALKGQTPARDSYPCDDPETRRFLRYWFDSGARRELWALSLCISRVRNQKLRDVLWCAFSRMIIAKQSGVSLAMDLSHSRPHKVYTVAPQRPFGSFLEAVAATLANVLVRGTRGVGPAAKIVEGDNRQLMFQRDSFDLVITSPPYLNAIDYLRCSKFSLVWMGHSIEKIRAIRTGSVGAERGIDVGALPCKLREVVNGMTGAEKLARRHARMLARYVSDMSNSVAEVKRVLRPGGRAVYVVGNNQMGEVFVRNSDAVKAVAAVSDLRLQAEYSRDLPPNRRYLPPPSLKDSGSKLQARMRAEVVLTFSA